MQLLSYFNSEISEIFHFQYVMLISCTQLRRDKYMTMCPYRSSTLDAIMNIMSVVNEAVCPT